MFHSASFYNFKFSYLFFHTAPFYLSFVSLISHLVQFLLPSKPMHHTNYFFNFFDITMWSHFPFIFLSQTSLTFLGLFKNSWNFSPINSCYTYMWIFIIIPKYINTSFFVCITLLTYIFTGLTIGSIFIKICNLKSTITTTASCCPHQGKEVVHIHWWKPKNP